MIKTIYSLLVIIVLVGCGQVQSQHDACVDSKALLWDPNAHTNAYKGNERYWDAITTCGDKY